MRTNQIRLACLALLIGSAVIAIIPVWPEFVTPHMVFLSILMIGAAAAINGFRRLGEPELERNFRCVLIGLAISLALSLLTS